LVYSEYFQTETAGINFSIAQATYFPMDNDNEHHLIIMVVAVFSSDSGISGVTFPLP
jgi:hypothetical protein